MQDRVVVGRWEALRSEGRLRRGDRSLRIEPKILDLLFTLASRRGEVFSREELMRAVWPGTTVGEDALAQCVFKLRKVLGEDRRQIETIPKRGYRLVPATALQSWRAPKWPSFRPLAVAIVGAVAVGGVGFQEEIRARSVQSVTLARADDSYMQFRRNDNEAAIRLYERVLAANPNSPQALAGLASGLVQRALRWPEGRDAEQLSDSALGAALESGQLRRPAVAVTIERALRLARHAAASAPRDPNVLRALGLALSANGRLADAAAVYDRALTADPDHWGLLINRADLHDIGGETDAARVLLERAYAGMSHNYLDEPARVRPWQARLGLQIARRYEQAGDLAGARRWYSRTLYDDPSAANTRR